MERSSMLSQLFLAEKYLDAKDYLINCGYAGELDWQSSISFKMLEEADFLRESGWVILNSGFKTAVVEKVFDDISKSFDNWSSASSIVNNMDKCRSQALRCFKNEAKINAICSIAIEVDSIGFQKVKSNIQLYDKKYLQKFSYIGPITVNHLLKNIGFPLAKADRHLSRISTLLGYLDAQELCKDISTIVGDSIAEVDYVLWRLSTIINNIYDFWYTKNKATPTIQSELSSNKYTVYNDSFLLTN